MYEETGDDALGSEVVEMRANSNLNNRREAGRNIQECERRHALAQPQDSKIRLV